MNARKLILALLLIVLAAPCVRACEEEGGEADTGPEPLVVREGAFLDIELDSTWTELEPGSYLLHLRRSTGAWVAETWFYRLPSDPTRVLTHAELVEMRAAGRLEPWDEPTTVVYQVLLYAQSEAQAARLAHAMHPRTPPARVIEAVLEQALLEAGEEGC
jgi:hypothetical protein